MSEKRLIKSHACPRCGSTDNRFLAKLEMLKCRRCGKMFELPTDEGESEGEASE
jgi:ribosomal protein L37AE/L43A